MGDVGPSDTTREPELHGAGLPRSTFDRRRLLTVAGGAIGASAAASLFPPNLRKAMADTPARPRSSLRDIEHVVILMQENRSFDHYFGTMKGVRGFHDPEMAKLPNGRPLIYQPDEKNPAGYLLPFRLDTMRTSSQAIPSTSHAWKVQHAAWNGGKMDNWLAAHRQADGNEHGPFTMGHYAREDIPFHFALAENFTICDRYHSSVLGPTWPNRLYHWTATIDPTGTGGGPVVSNVVSDPFRWTTYPERLAQAGVSWHVYQAEDDYGCNPLEFFAAFQDSGPRSTLHRHGLTISPADRFADDARNDRLPTVSWIIPTSPQSEHPDYIPAAGADYAADYLDAVAANRDVWNKTVFILNYDENDGLFDHMIPLTAPPGTANEYIDGQPIGAGVRVPCIIVSPWTMGGFVAQEPFDHTSVLRFLERVTGVRETNITAWRRRTFGDLTSALGFPSHRPFPSLPATGDSVLSAEHGVATLPRVTIPGTDQVPPRQDAPGRTVTPVTTTATALSGSRAQTTSRLVENQNSHRADFANGFSGTSFPGVLAAVAGQEVTATETAYVCGIVNYTISVIDTEKQRLVGGIDAGTNPYGIAAVGDGTLYVSNSGASDVSIVDTASNTIHGSVTVGLFPHGIAAAPDGRDVYVANTGPDTSSGDSRTVSVIDTGTRQVARTLEVGSAPQQVAVAPDGRTLYVTCADGLAFVDTGTGRVRAWVPNQARSRGLAVSPDGATLYVANTGRHRVSVLDARSAAVRASIPVGDSPWRVAFAPDGQTAYVTNANDDSVSVIDARRHQVIHTVGGVGHIPTGITADTKRVWLTANTSSIVTAIDATTLTVAGGVPLGLSTEPSDIVLVTRPPARPS